VYFPWPMVADPGAGIQMIQVREGEVV
jgi:hypothetical protein